MKYSVYLRPVVVLLVMLAAGVSLVVANEQDGLVDAAVLWYEEQEPGTDVYPVRILVTNGHVRIDDGIAESDFVLLDRRTQVIYSVSHEEQTTMEIVHHPVKVDIPDSIRLAEDLQTDVDAPAIGGNKPQHIKLTANGATCYEAIIVPGLLEDAAAALAEYARTLGDRQLNSLQEVPVEIQTPCFLLRYAYAPDRHYRQGLPVQEWDDAGYRRALVNFSADGKVSRLLFVVPASYPLFHIGG
jgi:hypothetical protein